MPVTGWSAALGLGLLALGAVAGAPGLMLVGVLALLVAWLRGLWARFGLRDVTYERHLGTDRAVWGDEIPLDVTVWNRKLLPLAWLRTHDFVSDGAHLRERELTRSDTPGMAFLENRWTLAWFERVVRHFHLVADRRGIYRFENVRLEVADLFATATTSEERRARQLYVVRPRSVPVRRGGPERAMLGTRRARMSLFEDPALFAGVRPYQPGDPLKRIHWKSTARTGRPVSKRFDPSRERQVVIAVDMQTLEGPHWMMVFDDDAVEGLCVAAASLARSVLADGSACGLALAAFTGTPSTITYIPPGAASAQLGRISDVLGRASSFASLPFERLLGMLARRMPSGATVVTCSARDPSAFLPAARRLAGSGFDVRHVALGGEAETWARRAREAGIPASVGRLEPDWQHSDALVLAG